MRWTCINQIAINLREFEKMINFHAVCDGQVGDSLILASSCSNKSNVQIGLYLTEMNFCFTRTPTSYLPPHFSFSTVKIKYRCLWYAIKFVTVSDNLVLISLAEFTKTHGPWQVQVEVAAICLCSTKWRSLKVIQLFHSSGRFLLILQKYYRKKHDP